MFQTLDLSETQTIKKNYIKPEELKNITKSKWSSLIDLNINS